MLRKLIKNTSGNVGLIFAIVAVPLVLGIGVAVDMGNTHKVRSQMQVALDAASLAAGVDLSRPDSEITSVATQTFNVNFDQSLGTANLTTTILPDRSGVRVSATLPQDMAFMGLAGLSSVDISTTSLAVTGAPTTYADLHILVDKSLSMGMPSDPNVPAPLSQQPGSSNMCFIACHDDGAIARGLGVSIKIDVVAAELIKLVNAIDQAQSSSPQSLTKYHFYTFEAGFETVVQNVADPGLLLNVLASPISLVGPSDLNVALQDVDAVIPTVGDGSAADSPRQILLFVTDADHRRAVAQYASSHCTSMKDRGVEIFAFYVHHRPDSYIVPGSSQAGFNDADLNGGPDPSGGFNVGMYNSVGLMQACASSTDHYFTGESGTEIAAAFLELTGKMTSGGALRLAE